MKITKDELAPDEVNVIRRYAAREIVVGETSFSGSVIVTATSAIGDWAPEDFNALTPAHLDAVLALQPEIVLLGSGERQRFPPAEIVAHMARCSVGMETMDTGAACRTYNILLAEGRPVAAALFPIGA